MFFEFGYYIIICVLVLYLLVLHIKVEKKLYCIYWKNDVSNLGRYISQYCEIVYIIS